MIPGLLAPPPILDICQTKSKIKTKMMIMQLTVWCPVIMVLKPFFLCNSDSYRADFPHVCPEIRKTQKTAQFCSCHCIFHYTILGQEVMEKKIVAKRPKSDIDIIQSKTTCEILQFSIWLYSWWEWLL